MGLSGWCQRLVSMFGVEGWCRWFDTIVGLGAQARK